MFVLKTHYPRDNKYTICSRVIKSGFSCLLISRDPQKVDCYMCVKAKSRWNAKKPKKITEKSASPLDAMKYLKNITAKEENDQLHR